MCVCVLWLGRWCIRNNTTHALHCNFCTEIETVVCNGIAIVCCIDVFLLFLDGTTNSVWRVTQLQHVVILYVILLQLFDNSLGRPTNNPLLVRPLPLPLPPPLKLLVAIPTWLLFLRFLLPGRTWNKDIDFLGLPLVHPWQDLRPRPRNNTHRWHRTRSEKPRCLNMSVERHLNEVDVPMEKIPYVNYCCYWGQVFGRVDVDQRVVAAPYHRTIAGHRTTHRNKYLPQVAVTIWSVQHVNWKWACHTGFWEQAIQGL